MLLNLEHNYFVSISELISERDVELKKLQERYSFGFFSILLNATRCVQVREQRMSQIVFDYVSPISILYLPL